MDRNGYNDSIMPTLPFKCYLCGVQGDTDMKETWKEIPGYEGLYSVSSMGRVKSLGRSGIDSVGRRYQITEKVLAGQINHDGYIRYELRKNGYGKKVFGHRLVMETFFPCDVEKEVNHKNLDKADNRIENLEWVTHKENMVHAKENDALLNRRTRAKRVLNKTTGETYQSLKEVAEIFGVGQASVSSACQGKHKLKGHVLVYG